jgi:ribosomal protein S18 acetylase RimI-like enzyme
MATIRPLTVLDAELYRSIRLTSLLVSPVAFGSSYEEEVTIPLDEYASRLKEDERIFVLGAFENDTIVGIVRVYAEKRRKLSHKATIFGLFVMPEYQRRGIAKALMREAIYRAGAIEDIEQINLSVVSGNTEALNLYQLLGFEIYGHERRAVKISDGNYVDEYHLVLFL